ncbi:MAG: ribosome hibernation-promoting factor, HPF/YfiA family [Gammaproteobacteria bacterium]|jgi:putative sigma-54 modulation protein
MQLSISGHHVDVTDALRDYAQDKILRLERHNDHVTNAHLVLTVEKQIQRAEATLHVVGGEVFADAEAPDLYAAIDLLIDKLDRQLVRHKERAIERLQGKQ